VAQRFCTFDVHESLYEVVVVVVVVSVTKITKLHEEIFEERKSTIPSGEARDNLNERRGIHVRISPCDLYRYIFFMATLRTKERVLVIPCLFVVYRWTAHPNVAGRPVPELTVVRRSLAFPLACVPVRFRR
jgi:hypothetical protein